MKIVPIEAIPKLEEVEDAPEDKLMDVYKAYQEMEILLKNENGLGVSAVQVGVPWRMFIIKNDEKYECYLNCSYEPIEQKTSEFVEGCLSIRNEDGSFKTFKVPRWDRVKVTGKKLLFDHDLCLEDVNEIYGFSELGTVFQHEIDHQEGVLISDIGKEFEVW
jgi:peptide deformylase